MASSKTKKLNPKLLAKDVAAHNALKGITNYTPASDDFSVAKIDSSRTAMDSADAEEVQAYGVYLAKRDAAVAAKWAFHDMILGAKNQVVAQFGDDSDEVQSLGLKKKSERKAPTRKVKPPQS